MSTITLDDMRDKLLSLDTVREALATTEPLTEISLPIGSTHFTLESGWNHGLDTVEGTTPVSAYVGVGSSEFQLSKDALLQAAAKVGLQGSYVKKTPARLIEDHLNYWYGEESGLGDKELKLLVTGETGSAITAASLNAFSNLRLLEESLNGIEAKFGKGEVLVDSKFHHSLARTHVRLIVPEHTFTIENSGTPDDIWSMGINLQNSLTGDSSAQTSLDGYLFRWWCTNGAIDTHTSSGKWSRKSGGQNAEDVYEWARAAVDDVLGGLEGAFEDIQAMTSVPVAGDVNQILREIFSSNSIPARNQQAVIANLVEDDELTLYTLMQAVTSVANTDGIDPKEQSKLMAVGGGLVHSATDRCDSCHRLM